MPRCEWGQGDRAEEDEASLFGSDSDDTERELWHATASRPSTAAASARLPGARDANDDGERELFDEQEKLSSEESEAENEAVLAPDVSDEEFSTPADEDTGQCSQGRAAAPHTPGTDWLVKLSQTPNRFAGSEGDPATAAMPPPPPGRRSLSGVALRLSTGSVGSLLALAEADAAVIPGSPQPGGAVFSPIASVALGDAGSRGGSFGVPAGLCGTPVAAGLRAARGSLGSAEGLFRSPCPARATQLQERLVADAYQDTYDDSPSLDAGEVELPEMALPPQPPASPCPIPDCRTIPTPVLAVPLLLDDDVEDFQRPVLPPLPAVPRRPSGPRRSAGAGSAVPLAHPPPSPPPPPPAASPAGGLPSGPKTSLLPSPHRLPSPAPLTTLLLSTPETPASLLGFSHGPAPPPHNARPPPEPRTPRPPPPATPAGGGAPPAEAPVRSPAPTSTLSLSSALPSPIHASPTPDPPALPPPLAPELRPSQPVPPPPLGEETVAAASGPPTAEDPEVEQRRCLAHWVPRPVAEVYAELKVRRLFEWQRACLEERSVTEDGGNLIYCAPTSGGKTLVAEVLLIRRMLQHRHKRALVVLPYIALVEEKVAFLERLCAPVGLSVRGHAGSKGGRGVREDIAVCTIEKANGIVNAFVEAGRLEELTMVVVDEIHSIDDSSRGYLLELLLTKLLYTNPDNIQIVGMSATLPNAHVLAKWLHDATFFVTNFRPVPLTEYFKVGPTVYGADRRVVRTVPGTPEDPDGVVALCNEVIAGGYSVLVFCGSKRQCETTAMFLAKLVLRPPTTALEVVEGRQAMLQQLKGSPAGIDPVLEETVGAGVAYHHAGLTMEEREVVERGYRQGVIQVLTCTTTLAAGVNLPARRVIFRTPRVAGAFLEIIGYKQAAGRAGRAGLDEAGESFLIAPERDAEAVFRLMQGRMPAISSCLTQEKRGMTRALLEAVASGVVSTVYDIQRYICCTFYAAQSQYTAVHEATKKALAFLEEHDFIQWNGNAAAFAATKLGLATFASSLSPDEGLVVKEEVGRARDSFNLNNELHLVYHLTPVFHGIEPDWKLFYWLWSQLPKHMTDVARALEVEERYLFTCQSRPPPRHGGDRKATRHRRFFVALLLYDLIHEYTLYDVAQKYGVTRGELQKLQDMSGTFAGMVGVFCERLNWWGFESLIAKVQERLSHGVEADIVPLVLIPHVKPHRARALYNAGFRTPLAVATASPETIERVLGTTLPYHGKRPPQQEAWSPNDSDLRLARLVVKGAKAVVAQQAADMQMDFLEMNSALNPAAALPDPAPPGPPAGSAAATPSPRAAPAAAVPSQAERGILPCGMAGSSGANGDAPGPAPLPFTLRHLGADAPAEEVAAFLAAWQASGRFAYHVALQPGGAAGAACRGVSVAFSADQAVYLAVAEAGSAAPQRLAAVKRVMETPGAEKVTFDTQAQLRDFLRLGITPAAPLLDPRVADWILNPTDAKAPTSLDALLERHVRHMQLKGRARTAPELGGKHAVQSLVAMDRLRGLLQFNQLDRAFREVEMPLVPLLARMELCGVGFDASKFDTLVRSLRNRLADLEVSAHRASGYAGWSLTSLSDVAHVLFDRLRLPEVHVASAKPKPKKRRRVEKPSTNATVLQQLSALTDCPVPGLILQHRQIHTLLSRYLDALPQHRRHSAADRMDRLHGRFLHTTTSTGRIQVADPELQTIPRTVTLPLPSPAGTGDVPTEVNTRAAFVARPGCVLLSADYSQIEARIMAHFSQDPELCDALTRGGDIFRRMSAALNNKPEAAVTAEERALAKRVCYGVMYGQGKAATALELAVAEEVAEECIQQFRARYPGVAQFLSDAVVNCRRLGYVETLYDRRRYLPAIYSRNPAERAQAERQAINTICQGSAADLVKTAMIRIHAALNGMEAANRSRAQGTVDGAPWAARMVLQIHDELLFEVHAGALPAVQAVIQQCMESAVQLRVPTPVNIRTGPSWGNLAPYVPPAGSR